MSSDVIIQDLFTQNLPSVQSNSANEFSKGMNAYYSAFKVQQEKAMNPESIPDYHNAFHKIMEVQKDDYWVHSPQFRKVLALAISNVFKTEITMLSPPCLPYIYYTMVFVDEYKNRWIISLQESASDPNKLSICARLPRSSTKTQYSISMTEKELSSADFNASCVQIFVQDTKSWHTVISQYSI